MTTMTTYAWAEQRPLFLRDPEFGFRNYGRDLLLASVLDGRLPAPLVEGEFERVARAPESLHRIAEAMVALGGRAVRLRVDEDGAHSEVEILAWEAGFVHFGARREIIFFNVFVANEGLARQLIAAYFENTTAVAPRAPQGQVHVLQRQRGQIEFRSIGYAGVPLLGDNYAPEVLADYDHAARDLENPTPCGRLVVLSGPPGVGKTYLTRALIAAASVSFVLVPAHAAESLVDPEVIPALVRLNGGESTPIVLVVEDADAALSPRKAENMTAIATLLNLTDGILGALLHLRVLATTNSAHVEIEPALLRPGRLCRHVQVGPLEAGQANRILGRLTGGAANQPFQKPTLLTDVYRAAERTAR